MPRTCLLITTSNYTVLQPFSEPYPVGEIAFAFYYFSSQQAEKGISLFVSEDTS